MWEWGGGGAQDNYLTEEQLAEQESEVDDLLLQFKAKGNVRKARAPVAEMNGSKLDRRRAEDIPADELLQVGRVPPPSAAVTPLCSLSSTLCVWCVW